MSSQGKADAPKELAEKAAIAPRHLLDPFFKETAKEVLTALARNPHLQEPDFLRLLERKDLPAEAIREIAVHKEAARRYAVKLALARHPRTPRLITLPILKFLYLFDLLRVAQTPGVPADVKIVAEETILKKADTLPRGEKITLARRASGRVVAGLLVTEDPELLQAGLGNPFLTEAHILKLLARQDLPSRVVETLALHDKWSHRYHVRLALMRNPSTPLQQVLIFLPEMAVNDLREICLDRRMPEPVRTYILNHCIDRLARAPRILPPEP